MRTRRSSPLNRHEYASIFCSILIIIFPFMDHYLLRLYDIGILDYLDFTMPLGIIRAILSLLGKSVRCGLLAFIAAFPDSTDIRHFHWGTVPIYRIGRPNQPGIGR